MCTAQTGVALGLQAASTALEVGSQIQRGNYAADVARNNAIIARQAAGSAVARGAALEARSRLVAGQVVGRQDDALAAAHVSQNSGSALALHATTQAMSDYDAETIRTNAAQEAYGYRAQGDTFDEQGRLAQRAATYAAEGSILSGIGKLAGIGGPAWMDQAKKTSARDDLLSQAPGAPEDDLGMSSGRDLHDPAPLSGFLSRRKKSGISIDEDFSAGDRSAIMPDFGAQ